MLTQFNAKWRDYCWMSFLPLYTVFLTLHTLYKHNILPSMSSTNQVNCTILTLSWKVKNWFVTVTWLLKNYSSPTKFVFCFFYHKTVHTSALFIILQNNVWNTDSYWVYYSSLGKQILFCNAFLKISASIGTTVFYYTLSMQFTFWEKLWRMEKVIEIIEKQQQSHHIICSFVRFFHLIIPSHFAYTLPVALVIIKGLNWNLQTSQSM